MENFGMFTTEGNKRVASITSWHKKAGSSWEKVARSLEMLGKVKEFEEATDTVVRDLVFEAVIEKEIN